VGAFPVWLLLSLLCALAWAAVDGLCKRALREHGDAAVLGARWLYALPALLGTLAFVPTPPLDGVFWGMLALSAPLEVWTMFLYLRAIAIAPLSLTAPLLAWTPVFSAAFSAAALRELPTVAGSAGILLVVAGSWLLYSAAGCDGLEPLRCIARERGARLMLAVALLFSVTSALGKVGLLHSSAAFFGPAYVAALAAGLVVVALARGQARELLSQLRPNRWFVAIGAGVAAMTVLHFAAIGMAKVAYVVAVKRSSLLASVVVGRVFFGERGLRRRLPGAALMLAGVALLALAD
jgi:drug/metabolite transporter (DMT)-like permease